MSAGIDTVATRTGNATPGSAPLVVSIDELRAVCRVTDAVLPPLVTDEDDEIEAVDVAALRGLAARGLVALVDDEELWIADDLLATLAPTRAARIVVEVAEHVGDESRMWAALGSDTGPTTVMSEHGPGLLRLEVLRSGVAGIVIDRCDLTGVQAGVTDHGFTVPRAVHEAMSNAIDEGATGAATDALAGAGTPAEAADAFVEAMTARRRAVAVQVALNLGTDGDGPFEAAEVRWVEGPDGTAWRMVVELSDEEAPAGSTRSEIDTEDEVFEARLAVAVQTIGRAALGAAIGDALTPTAPGGTGDDR